MAEEAKALEQTQADLDSCWRAFRDEQDAKFEERLKAGIERSQNFYNDHVGAHDKRKDLEADRKLNAASSPASVPK